jgi:hypothetical protein
MTQESVAFSRIEPFYGANNTFTRQVFAN